MPCTTILVGKKASYDGSTMIARNDDGRFDTKKLIVVEASDVKKKYKSIIGELEIELPDNPLSLTLTPNVDTKFGMWPANGINSKNVGMTATETITTNALVLGADPYVVAKKDKNGKKVAGGIGEEDLVYLVLPFISSAKEGVLRLGSLLEKYGTYESNGIAFNDENEIWWLESIGGHHWIAKRVDDDKYVMMPNQFGLDNFDFDDAYNEGKSNLCSKDLLDFVKKNHLYVGKGNNFNPRLAFGSSYDSDHVYNTPRAWYMGRYFNPTTYKWDGVDADFTPESDNIPWSLTPEHLITVEDVKYILSSYYQGTPYNPYSSQNEQKKGIYRPIGVNRTDVMAILQIRGYMKDERLKGVEWICFGPNNFNQVIPVYTSVNKLPSYLSGTTSTVSTDSFYWTSLLIASLADPHFGTSIQLIERYQRALAALGHENLNKYDKLFLESKSDKLLTDANNSMCELARLEAEKVLKNVLLNAASHMKNGYNRADN